MVSVVVAVVGSRAEAEMVVGMLHANGVHARISADDAGGVDLALQAQGVRVLVPEDARADALRLLGESGVAAPPGRLNAFQRLVVRLLGPNSA